MIQAEIDTTREPATSVSRARAARSLGIVCSDRTSACIESIPKMSVTISLSKPRTTKVHARPGSPRSRLCRHERWPRDKRSGAGAEPVERAREPRHPDEGHSLSRFRFPRSWLALRASETSDVRNPKMDLFPEP